MTQKSLLFLILSLLAIGGIPLSLLAEQKSGFPKTRPEGANFPRPRRGESLDISPPGFCWWQAGQRGKVRYRLRVNDEKGRPAYESPLLEDPAHVPDRVLPAGAYAWTVEALDSDGRVTDTRESWPLAITNDAVGQPWVPPADLLARVPREHPRLLFPKATLPDVRATLSTTRREAFESLKREATRALKLTPPPEPDYDKLKDPAERRMAYSESFGLMRRYHDSGMVSLALLYALTGERKYGEAAKAILVSAAQWNPEGISSVMAPYGDEIGLGLARSAAQTYDWIYDLLSEAERDQVRKMLIARADQMLRRLTKRDFLAFPEASHDGRLLGYLVEHAIALAEEPRAQVWMDYAMRTLLTVFPHWGGQDGGWAEGVPYGLAYNTIYLMPFESLRGATGFDMWQRPFYRKIRYFFLYNISPCGEVTPFGDMEDGSVTGRASSIRSLLLFHALRYNDAAVRGWVDLLQTDKNSRPEATFLPGLLLPDILKPGPLSALPPDAAFFGVGWAALHSDLAHPRNDLLFMFKSSPYGAVSHSHADQNSFAIMKGGTALAIPGGSRYPTHGSPFHVKYTQQTMAHNAILVNGQGQVNRSGNRGGEIAAFESLPHMGYTCGDAANAYGGLVKRFRRHALLVRPSLIVVVDDLEATDPAEFQWLMHAREQIQLDEPQQTLISSRNDATMTVRLFTQDGFRFAQTNEWPMNPKEGYPKVTKNEPEKQWHFTATTRQRAAQRRIAAIMTVTAKDETAPECQIAQPATDTVLIKARFAEGIATVNVSLGIDTAMQKPILEARYEPSSGAAETLTMK